MLPLWGIIVAYEVARQLGGKAIFCERQDGRMMLRRGFSIEPGQRVLVVEDVITTGGSVQEVIDVVREWQGDVIGVGVLVDRSGGKVDFGVRTEAVLSWRLSPFRLRIVPLCREGRRPQSNRAADRSLKLKGFIGDPFISVAKIVRPGCRPRWGCNGRSQLLTRKPADRRLLKAAVPFTSSIGGSFSMAGSRGSKVDKHRQ